MDFDQICKDIKNLKIQGAENISIHGIKALSLKRDKNSVKKLLSLRPTEPCLRNSIKFVLKDFKNNYKKALNHFKESKIKIAKLGSTLIKDDTVVYTHCHSSTVVEILKQAKKQKKNFKVYLTETRPLLQGRITAKELTKYKIKVTEFVDSAAKVALKESDIFLFGADAIDDKGNIYNKIGTGMFVDIASELNVKSYCCTNSWKFNHNILLGKKEVIEERSPNEVWRTSSNIKIKNPAFEFVDAKKIKAIVSELGISKPKEFVKKVKQTYPWIVK